MNYFALKELESFNEGSFIAFSYGERQVQYKYRLERITNCLGGNPLSELALDPSASEDGYAVTWDEAAKEYTLSTVSAGAPGIDDVLAEAQALSAPRTIEAGTHAFAINSTAAVTLDCRTIKLDASDPTGAYTIGDGAGNNLPVKNSDESNIELMHYVASTGVIGSTNPSAYLVIESIGDPTDGVTTAFGERQLALNVSNGTLWYATTKSTDPDSSGAGSVWSPITVGGGSSGLTVTVVGSSVTLGVAGIQYACRTVSGSFQIRMPGSPTAGDQIAFSDVSENASVNNITVDFTTNSQKYNSQAANIVFNTDNFYAKFEYVNTTNGWALIGGSL